MTLQNTHTQSPSPLRDGVDPQHTNNASPFRDGVAPFRDWVSSRVSKLDSARLLYMAGDTTQKSIAAQVGVSERTMHSWIKDNGWDRLRHASRTAPAIIAENMFSQIVELQNDIASREEGKRYPTMQEAELTRKLCLSIDRMKNAPALSQSMQVLRLFRSFAQTHFDSKFHLQLNLVIEHFLEGEAKNGYLPYQIEYGPNEHVQENPFNDNTHSASPAQECSEDVEPEKNCEGLSTTNTENEITPEIATRETHLYPSKVATGKDFSPSNTTSGTGNDPQKPEVKRKFSHSMLNKIASPGTSPAQRTS